MNRKLIEDGVNGFWKGKYCKIRRHSSYYDEGENVNLESRNGTQVDRPDHVLVTRGKAPSPWFQRKHHWLATTAFSDSSANSIGCRNDPESMATLRQLRMGLKQVFLPTTGKSNEDFHLALTVLLIGWQPSSQRTYRFWKPWDDHSWAMCLTSPMIPCSHFSQLAASWASTVALSGNK
jgi:hypothetical protein